MVRKVPEIVKNASTATFLSSSGVQIVVDGVDVACLTTT